MKRTLTLLFALLLSVTLNAQLFFEETFDGTELPSGWNVSGEGGSNFVINASNYAGGDANEVGIAGPQQGFPEFNGVARLSTAAYDFTGIEELVVSFKQTYVTYAAITAGIAASADNGETWTTLWSQVYNGQGGNEVRKTVSFPEDMDKSSVRLSWYLEGDANNLYAWFFDNFFALAQKTNDISLQSINIPEVVGFSSDATASFTVKNFGTSVVSSFIAKYKFEGYEEVEEQFSTYMAPFTSKNFSFKTATTIDKLSNTKLTIEIIAVNNTEDEAPNNNKLDKNVGISWGAAQRIPMIEHFSGSYCGPCVYLNPTMHSLTTNNPGKYTYTKYAISIAGGPDSHNTAECNTRFNFYNGMGVPAVYIDAINYGIASNSSLSTLQNYLNERYNTTSFSDIRGAFNVEGNTIKVTADFMSYADLNNIKAFVTVNEKTIEKQEGAGEGEYHHIMLKMLGGTSGTTVSLRAGEPKHLEFSHNMATTKMQDIEDLEVALWLQNIETGEVFNSRFAYEYTDHCYPVKNLNLVVKNNEVAITWEAPEQGTPTGYNLYNNGTLVAENTTEMSHSVALEDYNVIAVVAVYGEDKTSVPVAKLAGLQVGIEEEQVAENTFNIYPNPAKDYVRVCGENINTISVYNSLGMLVEKINVENDIMTIDLSDYNTGVYFINVEQNNGVNTTKKMVVTH